MRVMTEMPRFGRPPPRARGRVALIALVVAVAAAGLAAGRWIFPSSRETAPSAPSAPPAHPATAPAPAPASAPPPAPGPAPAAASPPPPALRPAPASPPPPTLARAETEAPPPPSSAAAADDLLRSQGMRYVQVAVSGPLE